MAITFTGGQLMPAYGTQAYSALSSAQKSGVSGAGSYNPSTGSLTVGGKDITSQITAANTTSPIKTTAPVISGSSAQDDYISKFNAFDSLLKNVQAQQETQQRIIAQQQAERASRELQAAEQNLKQQGIDIQKTQALAQQQAAQAKLEAAKSLTQPEGEALTSTQPSAVTSTTPVATNGVVTGAPSITAGDTTATPSTTAGTTETTQPTANYVTGLAGIQDERTDLVNSFLRQAKNQMVSLDASENALLESTRQNYESIIQTQEKANLANVGVARQAAFRAGGEYTPEQASDMTTSAITTGNQRLASLNSEMAKTIASLKLDFAKQDYEMINKNFSILDDNLKSRRDTITSVHDAVAKDLESQRDYELKIQNAKTDAQKEYDQYVKDSTAKGIIPVDIDSYIQAREERKIDLEVEKAIRIEKGKAAIAAYTAEDGTIPETVASGTGGITQATGLSLQAFNYLTQGTASMSRMPAQQRNQIMAEANKFLSKNNIDVSTFQSQYKAYNDVLQKNISRFNNTKIMENEVISTADLLKDIASDKDLGSLKWGNIAKVFAGEQVNDPLTIKYAFHLSQMRNELAGFFAASQGKSSPDVVDNQEADRVIKNGINSGSVQGFKEAVESATGKMSTVLGNSVESAQKSVWGLFGVEDKYTPKPATGDMLIQQEKEAESSITQYKNNNPDQSSVIDSRITKMEQTLGRPITAQEFLQAFPEYK